MIHYAIVHWRTTVAVISWCVIAPAYLWREIRYGIQDPGKEVNDASDDTSQKGKRS